MLPDRAGDEGAGDLGAELLSAGRLAAVPGLLRTDHALKFPTRSSASISRCLSGAAFAASLVCSLS